METYKDKTQFDLPQTVADLNELEAFIRQLVAKLHHEKFKDGEDLMPHIKAAGIKIPEFIKGQPITYSDHNKPRHEKNNSKQITFIGKPEEKMRPIITAMFCIEIGTLEACFECGWLFCWITLVITY